MSFAATLLPAQHRFDLRVEAEAAAAWDLQWSLLPDCLNYRDYRDVEQGAVERLFIGRWYDGRFPRRRAAVRWPKGFDETRYREVADLDSLDQLAYRAAVAPIASSAERALPPNVVAHRVDTSGSTWRPRGLRWGGEQRRRLLSAARLNRSSCWLGKTDVRNHYPTVDVRQLKRSLSSTCAPSWAIDIAIDVVERLNGCVGHQRGVPVGPEASALLGTISLISLDRTLREAEVWWVRFVDDVWLLADGEDGVNSGLDVVQEQLVRIGQVENADKRGVFAPDEIDDATNDADVAYLAQRSRRVSSGEAIDLVLAGLADESHSKVAFGLGALRSAQSPLGLPLLLEYPALLRAEPEASGKYVRAVVPSATPDQLHGLVAIACAADSSIGLAGRIRLTHALGCTALDATCGDQLAACVVDADHTQLGPLKAHIAVASSRSRSMRSWQRLASVAEDGGGLDFQRAVVGCAPRCLSNSDRRRLTSIGRCQLDAQPFVEAALRVR